jgi:DNA-binding CsgD family transcriptional regulator
MVANRENRPRLCGRQGECATLAGLVEDARRGTSAVLVLRAEPGAGKTALVDYAVGLAPDLRVVRVEGTESERELAYAGLHQLCGSMLGLLDRLPPPQRDALEIAFGVRAGPGPDRLAVGVGLLSLLALSAAERPLVCVVEDTHWLDRASVQALAFAVRRLSAESTLVIFTAREPVADLAGLPEMVLGGLRDADARDLLDAGLLWPLDERVREQILTETRGNPRALLELLHGLSPARLAGGFGLPGVLPGGIPGELLFQLDGLPAQTFMLLLTAAADPTGDPALIWRAAGRLAIPADAADPATEAGLVAFGRRVVFRDRVVRSAVYRSAPLRDRHAAHDALAQATDPQADPDRRAWHRSHALWEPEEDVAAELDRTAARAQVRGGLCARAAFLERAAVMTPQAARRQERSLTAAAAMLAAGEPDAAAKLLDVAEAGVLDDHQQAIADLQRARLAFAVNRGGDAPRLLLDAAQQLNRFDAVQARGAYLDAIGAAIFAAGLAVPGASVALVTHAAHTDSPGPPDPLLDGLAACFGDGHPAGAPVLRRALNGFGHGMTVVEQLRWLPLACAAALRLWDEQAWDTLSSRHVRLAREAGAIGDLPLALTSLACLHVLAGELSTAQSLVDESDVIAEAANGRPAPFGVLGLAALRGRLDPALALIDSTAKDAALRGEGLGLAAAKWATAVLYNGLGQYEEALSAAEESIGYGGALTVAHWAMAEMIEAAARTEQPGRAAEAMRDLSQVATAAGTDWALGVRARSLAVLSTGQTADNLYRTAIRHLSQSRARVDLARAHLLYGEWLRRENRRVDARQQLRQAHELLGAMGADGFAERARRELLAIGETVRKRTVATATGLTAQELRIALRARDGQTNTEIGTELFVSPRTVEWHLRKVFAKLGITSRRQLRHALPSPAAAALPPVRTTTCCPARPGHSGAESAWWSASSGTASAAATPGSPASRRRRQLARGRARTRCRARRAASTA